MQTSVRFSIAVHILLCTCVYSGQKKVTSDLIAAQIGTNPVVIRKIMRNLNDAGMIESPVGIGGIRLLQKPENITLQDVFKAVEGDGHLFRVHDAVSKDTPAGRIHDVVTESFGKLESAMDETMASVTLGQLIRDYERPLKKKDTSYILL